MTQELVGADHAHPIGTVASDTSISYFKGAPNQWLIGVPSFEQIAYADAWPGIEVRFERAPQGVKSEYVVSPGADPAQIRLAWRGANTASVAEDGSLLLSVPGGHLREASPIAWQNHQDGRREEVAVQFVLRSDGSDGNPIHVEFGLGQYDRARSVIIDPVLAYAGYVGGNDFENATGIAVDSASAAYITGYTLSTESSFPIRSGPDISHNGGGNDAFVAKVKPDGGGLVYAGYVGGSDDDIATGIAVDSDGAAYIVGQTSSASPGFPITLGPDLTYRGHADAFVAKVRPDGSALTYAGYIGGIAEDQAYGVAVDTSGAAYVTGFTASTEASFPVKVGPSVIFGGVYDAFVAKVKPDGTGFAYAGYVGGANFDLAQAIAVDGSGAAYLAGRTTSDESTFPVAIGPDLSFNSPVAEDAFVAKVKPDGSALIYAGYIGGDADDTAFGIAVDGSGAAYVAGETRSSQSSFPTAIGPDLTMNSVGLFDAFVAKVKPDGSELIYSGYVGGAGDDIALGIAIDPGGAAYVVGRTTSSQASFPVRDGPDLSHNGDEDAFVAKVSPDGARLLYLGYVGGGALDAGVAIAVSNDGSAYVAGFTRSNQASFPEVVGPSLVFGGNGDAFVARIVTETPTATATATTTAGQSVTPTSTSSIQTPTPTPLAIRRQEDEDKPKTRPANQHTNQYGPGHYATGGNIQSVTPSGDGLLISLAQTRGETLVIFYHCSNHCPSLPLGSFITVEGEQGDDGIFEATDVYLERP